MPRQPRHFVPGVPQHLIQRGNNRQPCFFVHLLLTPQNAEGVSCMLQALGRYFVRYINSSYSRTGTLWEGRSKNCDQCFRR